MVSYSLALLATTKSHISTWVNLIPHPHLPWYLHWYCFCFVSLVHDIFIPMHHPSRISIRTRCDRRYHANPTRIGCLIRRRRSYLCSRRFGEHGAFDPTWGLLTKPASTVGSWNNDDVWKTVVFKLMYGNVSQKALKLMPVSFGSV